jgi:uncharacterized membrane protein YbhN (UPF0104 family)
MNAGKVIRKTAALTIILLVGYYYSLQVRNNWASLTNFTFSVNLPWLFLALFFCMLSFLLETYLWQVCINKHLGRRELNFLQSIAVVNASGFLKYIPGRIWTYTAQLTWLRKYDISQSLIIYVNIICMAGSVITSLYLGLIYVAFYTTLLSRDALITVFLALLLLNTAYLIWNAPLINAVISRAGRFLRKEIRPIRESRSLLVYIQFMYICSWSLLGLGAYLLAKGIGLTIAMPQAFAILAAMSLSWVAGYLAVITPGGLGVREGTMLVMLLNAVDTRTALIFPIVSRFMYLISEALLGLTALFIGMKHKVFSSRRHPSG